MLNVWMCPFFSCEWQFYTWKEKILNIKYKIVSQVTKLQINIDLSETSCIFQMISNFNSICRKIFLLKFYV